MAYQIQWLVVNKVIHLQIEGYMTLPEAKTAYDALQMYHKCGETPVHLVVEYQGNNRTPLTLNLYNFIIEGSKPHNQSYVVVVGTHRQALFLGKLFSHVPNLLTHYSPTLTQAQQFLKSVDARLGGMSAPSI